MKLQSKIAYSIIPLVLSSIFLLGSWSIKKAGESIHKSTFLYMNTVIDAYMPDIEKNHQLLVKNGLETIGSFVSEYKKHALKTAENIKLPDSSHLFIMDGSGNLVFCSTKKHTDVMASAWGSAAKKIGSASTDDGAPEYTGRAEEAGIETLYVARHFPPWDWVIFFAMEDQVVRGAKRQIRNATIGIAALCSILSIAMILVVFNKFFATPVRRISNSASAIAKGRHVRQIDVRSHDELGDLARNMETMSRAIQQHLAEIKQSHDKLETRVKERTMELETALSKIKTLKGLLPICMHCKKIRDDKGYWKQMEAYIQKNSEAEFSHSICEECAHKYYPGIDLTSD
ncbi:MAG: HAMP domain-containing protein [Desulfotignum sp.]|jgi:methyl-accepting chemotaxis protein|nr:HAMP domain-containing protein [Desulfotignum sp.]